MTDSRRPTLSSAPADVSASLTDTERAVLAISASHPQRLPAPVAVKMILTARASSTSVVRLLRSAVSYDWLLGIIAHEMGLVFVNMDDPEVDLYFDSSLLEGLDLQLLATATALPMRSTDDSVVVVMANPRGQADATTYLRSMLPQGFSTAIGLPDQILSKLLSAGASTLKSAANLEVAEAAGQEVNIVDWVETMLARAHAERASDVALRYDQDEGNARPVLGLRWRIDGVWIPQPTPVSMVGREREIIGTLLARCDTTNPSDVRNPQDGAFSFEVLGSRRVDARLGMVPQLHGPSITLRLLDPLNVHRNLDEMGFAPGPVAAMRKAINAPQGMIFVIGPTGSGKSTTLYGMLHEIDKVTRNVLTAEDPIEYRMEDIGQTQITSGLGEEKSLSFAKVLRSFMRMAPDVILVGEVRDEETAATAVHAALTGHLMLSTIHANSALGIFQRLEEMDIEPYLAAEAITLAVSQRLLRKLHSCRLRREPTPGEVAFCNRNGLTVPAEVSAPAPGGCPGCRGKGFFGRLPVVEIIEPTDLLRETVAVRASASKIREAASQGGWLRILDDAHAHVLSGVVPVSELHRVLEGI